MGLPENIYAQSPLWMQNLLVSAYGWQWKQRRFGGVFPAEYIKAKERENYSVQQWKGYEQQQLPRLLIHAFTNVPYYRESFSRAGITLDQIKKISAEKLLTPPVLTKEGLRKSGTSTLLAATKEKNGTFIASSGSTGTPTQILFSHAMHQRWMALFESRVRNWAGVNSFMPRGMIGGRRVLPKAANTPPYYRYNIFEKQVYFSAYHISAKNAKNYLEGIDKYQVQYMTGYAMSNFLLAGFFKELNLELPQLKAVITSSEKLTPEMRQTFSEVYHCKTYDGWSGVEACALITECEHGSLHVSPDAGIIELLDDDLKPVPTGVAGNVYCTGFINYDQPLIRYQIGDSMIMSGNACSCGRNMPVVQEILGRVEDVIVGKDGRQMVRFHSVFNGLRSVKQAQVIQNNRDEIYIKLVADGVLDRDEEIAIRKRIESQLGEIRITVETVKEIPLNNNGKFQAVISKLSESIKRR